MQGNFATSSSQAKDSFYEHLCWCWQVLHNFGTEICPLHVSVASSLVDYLATEGQLHRLREFVSSLSVDEYAVLYGEEKFINAMIGLHVQEENYIDALCLLKNGRFPTRDERLQLIWYDVHYKIAAISKGHSLTSLHKFRVRQRYPPPPSICWADQPLSSRQLSRLATPLLRAWANEHADKPYPSREELEKLVSQTGMSVRQIRMWFANARRRTPTLQGKRKASGRTDATVKE